MNCLANKTEPRTVHSITYQPALRPALPCVYGPLDYREQRALFERIDAILSGSGLEQEFVNLAAVEHRIDARAMSARQLERFARWSVLALRANIARGLTGLSHREFCVRLADSPLLQWFLHVGELDAVRVFSKSTSDRLGQWISEPGLRVINDKFTALLTAAGAGGGPAHSPAAGFGLAAPVACEEVFFDSTCLQAAIHYPVDWVLLRDAARTLMKATVLIRGRGLKHRMPQGPLELLSRMNTLCMQMSGKRRLADGRRHRKRVLRAIKALMRLIAGHGRAHLEALKARWPQTDLTEGQARVIIARMEQVFKQLAAATKQAHERIIGGRRVANQDKILSLYQDSLHVVVRGKAGADVEFGNKLWLAETREGVIIDYHLCRGNPADSALVAPAIGRLVDVQHLGIKRVWGDRGLASEDNDRMLAERGIGSGLCPRDVAELAQRLGTEPGFRAGLKRRAGTEARIGIFKNVFLGRPLPAKGFAHRELAVGWAVLSHNLWVVARLARAEQKRQAQRPPATRHPRSRAA